MNSIKSFSALSVSSLLLKVTAAAQSFLIRIFIGPELMGIWNLLGIVIGYARVFNAGMGGAVEREIPILIGVRKRKEESDVRVIFFSFIFIELLVIFTFYYGYIVATGHKYQCHLFIGLLCIGPLVLLERLGVFFTLSFQTLQEFVRLSKVRCLSGILSFGIIILSVYYWGYYGILTGFIIALFCNLLVFNYVRVKNNLFKLYYKIDFKEIKRLLAFGFPLQVSSYIWRLFVTIDSLIVTYFLGTTYLSYYTIGVNFVTQLSDIPTNISVMIYPKLLQGYGKDDENYIVNLLKKGIIGSNLIVTPAILAASYYILPTLIHLVIPKYEKGIDVFKILIFGLFMTPIMHLPGQLLTAKKKLGQIYLANTIGFIEVGICCLVAYMINKSLISIAFGTVIGYFIYFSTLWFFVSRMIMKINMMIRIYSYFLAGLIYTMISILLIDRLDLSSFISTHNLIMIQICKMSLAFLLLLPLFLLGSYLMEVKISRYFELLKTFLIRRQVDT